MKDNTDLELLTDYAIDVSESANGLNVLIKHDYYSSDSDNGRRLLNSILDGLIMAGDRLFQLIITDSAVKLIEESDKINDLLQLANTTLICSDSAVFYNVDISKPFPTSVHIVPITDITDQIIETRPIIILE
ncbi:MAG: hypothetical protein J6O00_02410 [Clostridiales bacterium]|nr:hypothetical protein [Clostridiales bacterium]